MLSSIFWQAWQDDFRYFSPHVTRIFGFYNVYLTAECNFLWQDISFASSVSFGATAVMDGDTVLTNQVNFIQQGTLDLCPSIQRSCSTLSPSISRLSTESTGLDSLESGLSPSIDRGEQQCDLHEEDIIEGNGGETDMMSNTDREKPRRCALILT